MTGREIQTKAQLLAKLLRWVTNHPDCTGVRLIGSIRRLQPESPGAPTWSHACEFEGHHVDQARCKLALMALVEHLQAQYDLAPEAPAQARGEAEPRHAQGK